MGTVIRTSLDGHVVCQAREPMVDQLGIEYRQGYWELGREALDEAEKLGGEAATRRRALIRKEAP